MRLIEGGASAYEAFHKAFGADFDNAVSKFSAASSDWTFEAGRADYVKLKEGPGIDGAHHWLCVTN